MAAKTKSKRRMSAEDHDAYCKTITKRIDARLREGKRMDVRISPSLKALKRFVDE